MIVWRLQLSEELITPSSDVFFVPQPLEETVGIVKSILRERTSERVVDWTVDSPVPLCVKEIWEVVPFILLAPICVESGGGYSRICQGCSPGARSRTRRGVHRRHSCVERGGGFSLEVLSVSVCSSTTSRRSPRDELASLQGFSFSQPDIDPILLRSSFSTAEFRIDLAASISSLVGRTEVKSHFPKPSLDEVQTDRFQ